MPQTRTNTEINFFSTYISDEDWQNLMADQHLTAKPYQLYKKLYQSKFYSTSEHVQVTVEQTPDNRTEAIPQTIVKNWQSLAKSCLNEQTYLYILRLARKESGWRGLGSLPLDDRSLGNFLRFWDGVREQVVEPEFVLVPNGNIQVEWYKNDSHFVELEFRPDNKILFGLFDGDTVFEGTASAKDVIALLSSRDLEPLKWSYGD